MCIAPNRPKPPDFDTTASDGFTTVRSVATTRLMSRISPGLRGRSRLYLSGDWTGGSARGDVSSHGTAELANYANEPDFQLSGAVVARHHVGTILHKTADASHNIALDQKDSARRSAVVR